MDLVPMTATTRPANSVRSTFLLWLIWILWLPLFIPAIVDLLQHHRSLVWVVASLLGAGIFFALYLWVSWLSAKGLASHEIRLFPTGVALWAPVLGLFSLATILTSMNGLSWGGLFIYTSSGAAGWLPTKKAAVVVVALVGFVGIVVLLKDNATSALSAITFVGIVGAIVIAFSWSVTNSQQLRIAREQLSRTAAVNEERLRIARDLHDLLGHNLSLIALKSELARRLVGVAPDRAAAEISDIEQVARQALQEVREAVASYRQPTLASELHGAREMLAVAGIAYHYEGAEDVTGALPAAVESALAWAVREGVTNVIRHSHARHCTIRLARNEETIRVEVIDDGIGTAVPAVDESVVVGAVGGGGNGLRGLAERVAALGGYCEAGAVEGGGFRVMVTEPLTQVASGAQPASNANNTNNTNNANNTGNTGVQNTIGASQA